MYLLRCSFANVATVIEGNINGACFYSITVFIMSYKIKYNL